MTATATAPTQRPVLPVRRLGGLAELKTAGPTIFAVLNALAFYLVRPGVNDLWAARARASAASHGVGLTYWFGWFGGGATPGNYSVVTPYLCAAIGTELVGALSAIAVTVLVTVLVRGTRHPIPAAAVAAVGAGINLWSGRIPFLLGAAVAVGALITLRQGRRGATVGLTVLSILASPVSGAFLVLGLSGTFLTTRTKAWRPIIAYVVITCGIALILVAVAFGAPGPEPFTWVLLIQLVPAVGFLLCAGAPDHLRTTLWVALIATFALWAIPNGLGSNFSRFVWFCLPVAVMALSSRPTKHVLLAVIPLLVGGSGTTIADLIHASSPASSVGYYTALAHELDTIPDLQNYRLEVVNHGAHAGYDALLDHAMLARGWETQEDIALNKSLNEDPLDPVTYKLWLDNNAVGYVALPSASVGGYPEYTLVQKQNTAYLHRIWSNADWQLFRVSDPTPIVGQPATITAHDQKSMTLSVPCACSIAVRVRWSKFLAATLQARNPSGPGTVDASPEVDAAVIDASGWTTITTTRPGTYVLQGRLRQLLH